MTRPAHPLEGLVGDYLNGHLSAADTERVETALANDPEFRLLVAFERQVRMSVREPQPETEPSTDTLAFERRLRAPATSGRRWQPALAAAACLTLVVALAWLRPGVPAAATEFTTLSDATPSYAQPALRVVVRDPGDIPAIREDFSLRVLTELPSVATIDVTGPADADLAALAERLRADPRVRLVEPL